MRAPGSARALAIAAALATGSAGLVASAAPASDAPSAGPPVLVVIADTAAGREVAEHVAARLPEPWASGSDKAARKTLGRTPGASLTNATGRQVLAKKAAHADARARAVLVVKVTPKHGGERHVQLLLVGRGDAAPVLDEAIDVPAGDDGPVEAAVYAALAKLAPGSAAPVVAAKAAPPTKRDAPPPPREPDKPEEPARPLGGAETATLILAAGGGIGSRFFRYHDGLSPTLRTYDLGAAPNLVVSAEVYPFARTSLPVLRWIGVAGGYQRALGLSSKTSDGTKVDTSWQHWDADLRARFVVSEDLRLVVTPHVGVAAEAFHYTGDPALVAGLPDVDDIFWRVGVDGRIGLGPVAALLGASFLAPIQGGDTADRFRQTSFLGMDLGGGLAVPLARVFELRAGATYTRVFYTFHPEVGDANVAGGALDHFVRAELLGTLLL